jgi:hypothetical protein
MTPRQVVETLLRARQLRMQAVDTDTGQDIPGRIFISTADWRPIIMCLRSRKEITLDNVHTIDIEHWPIKHEHGGPVSPDNAVVSLGDGHKKQTKREARDKAHERKLRLARLAKADVEKRIGKEPKWRLKKKLTGEVVRVRTR